MAQAEQTKQKDIVHAAEDIARAGLPEVESFFNDPSMDQEKKARIALKALSHYASIRSTRSREASTLVAMARLIGLRGEALTPVFEELTGRSVQNFLPAEASK